MRLLTLASAAIALCSAIAAQAESVKIRGSYVVAPADWAVLLPEKADLMHHNGKSYVLEPVRYQGTPQQITAIANSELEIATLAFSTLAIAIQNANLDDLRVDRRPIPGRCAWLLSQQYLVLKDGPIKKIEDLKGKVLAINVGRRRGRHRDAHDDAQARPRRQPRLRHRRRPVSDHEGHAAEKKADLIPSCRPSRSIRSSTDRQAAVRSTRHPRLDQILVWCARQCSSTRTAPRMTDFMEDVLRVTRWYLDPKNHDEVVEIAAG